MIFDDKGLEIEKVDAFYITRKNLSNRYIEILSKDGKYIAFSFNNINFDPKQLEKNKVIDLKNYINWDVELKTNETYYLFDLSKDIIDLTRLDDNLFNIKVHIENPDIIYSPSSPNASFKNLIIDSNFSFIYNENEKY